MFRRTSLSGSAFDRTQNEPLLRDRERFIQSLLEFGKFRDGRAIRTSEQPIVRLTSRRL